MNTTVVQQALTGDAASKPALDALRDGALGALIVVAIAVPGYVLAFFTIDVMGRFWMQMMGFIVCTGLFAALATNYHALVRAGGGAA